MTQLPAADTVTSSGRRRYLSRNASFYLLASITVSFLAGSSVPTPLYAIYQEAWGFSSTTLTVIYGAYALAVLSSLLIVGRLSDHLGRRPILIFSTFAQLLTMIAFALASSAQDLLVIRIVQGLITGAAIAAVGAGMIDIDRIKGSVANAVSPVFGTAIGALVGGAMVQYLPYPTHLVFALLGVVFALQCLGVSLMNDTVTPAAGAIASLKPRFTLPPATQRPMLFAMPAVVALWALAGFYGSLGPTLMNSLLGTHSPLLGSLVLFVLGLCAGLAVLIFQHREPQLMMKVGASALFVGTAITVASLPNQTVSVFFVGTIIAGVGFGLSFQGAVRSIMPLAAAHERAGVLSLIYVVSYLALGLPAIVAGYFLSQHASILHTAEAFGAVVMGLSALALMGTVSASRFAAQEPLKV